MEKRFLSWLGFGFAALAILAICGAIMHTISLEFATEKKGDLATWVGAIFAGLAFAGTIWIATTGARKKDREELALAAVTAASLESVTMRITHELDSALEAATKCHASAIHSGVNLQWFQDIRGVIALLQSISIVSREELKDLIPASRRSAMTIANVQGRVINCVGRLDYLRPFHTPVELIEAVADVESSLKVSIQCMIHVQIDVRDVVQREVKGLTL